MNEYIKTNAKNEIIDVFYGHQNKFDGTEIFTGDKMKATMIRNISNEYGVFIFRYDRDTGEVSEKEQSEIDSDQTFLNAYKKQKKDEIQAYIGSHLLDIYTSERTLEDIVTQWNNFKTNAVNWATKAQTDNAFNNAMDYLTS